MQTALANGHTENVELLLARSIEWVTQGQLEWLLDLRDTGFTVAEIASMLFESVKTAPWIDPEQPAIDLPNGEVRSKFHQLSCAHNKDSIEDREDPLRDPTAFHRKRDVMQRSVAAVYGLAGLFPPSKGLHIERGHISFAEDKALVYYKSESDTGHSHTTENMVTCTLENVP